MALRACRIWHIAHAKWLGVENPPLNPVGTSGTNADIRNISVARIAFMVDHKRKAGASGAVAPQVQRAKFRTGEPNRDVGNCHWKRESTGAGRSILSRLLQRLKLEENHHCFHDVSCTTGFRRWIYYWVFTVSRHSQNTNIYWNFLNWHNFRYYFTIAGVKNPIGIVQVSYAIQLVGNIVSWFVVDRVGRRPMVVYGMFVITATFLVIGGVGTIKNNKAAIQATVALMTLWGFLVRNYPEWYSIHEIFLAKT